MTEKKHELLACFLLAHATYIIMAGLAVCLLAQLAVLCAAVCLLALCYPPALPTLAMVGN